MILRRTSGRTLRKASLSSPSFHSENITADKREIKDFPKLPLATSFIRHPLSEIAGDVKYENDNEV